MTGHETRRTVLSMTSHVETRRKAAIALMTQFAVLVLLVGPANPAAALNTSIEPRSTYPAIVESGASPQVSSSRLRMSGYPVYVREVIGKTVLSTNFVSSTAFASCSIGTSGGTCTITSGRSVDRTIALSLGITRAAVAGSLGISSSASVTTTVSCTSPPLAAGSSWRAFPIGTRYRYQVKQTTFTGPITSYSTTSGYLYALDPKPSQIHCR